MTRDIEDHCLMKEIYLVHFMLLVTVGSFYPKLSYSLHKKVRERKQHGIKKYPLSLQIL